MRKTENRELLEVLTDEQFAKADMRDLIQALYFQVIQSQVIELELRKEISKLHLKIDVMTKEVAPLTHIRSKFIKLTYDARTSEVLVSNLLRIEFANTIENDLLRIMFTQKNGKQRRVKWQTQEIAERFKKRGVEDLSDKRQVYKVATRIKDKLRNEIKIDVLHVKGKEFFWYL